jgi:TonB family protein
MDSPASGAADHRPAAGNASVIPGARAIPWIVSLALHAAVVTLLVAAVFRATDHPVAERIVEILVVTSHGNAASRSAASSSSEQTGPRNARHGEPVAARATFDAVRGEEPHEPPASQPALTAAVPLPAVGEVLSDMPSDAASQRFEAMGTGESSGTQFGWEGPTRKLIRKRNPVFPAILSTAGQEVECHARITVSSSGKVTRVEIVRSSGYIEIDASVEAALRDYLFSRVDGRKDAVGTVRFRFRLERQD